MRFLISIVLLTSLMSCSHQSHQFGGYRYLAWLGGDVQSQYQPKIDEVRELLDEYQKNPPAIEDKENSLSYISLLSAAGRHAESNSRLANFLERYPEEKRAIFLLAASHLKQNKKELARYFYLQLEKDPGFVWKSLLLNNLGMIALKEGDRDVALDYFQKASQSGPEVAAPLVNLGSMYLESRSFDAAQKVFQRAVQLEPEFEDAHLGLGVALEGKQDFKSAHEVYAKFHEKNPKSLAVLYNDSIILGNYLNDSKAASRQMLLYIQRGGKETAKAQKFYKKWR